MMDIVEHLRYLSKVAKTQVMKSSTKSAADEIESLRRRVQDKDPIVEATIQHQAGEIMQLKQQLANHQKELHDEMNRYDAAQTALSGCELERDELVAALKQFAECDLNDDNCASLEVATRRIRSLAQAALAKLGADRTGEKA